MKIGEYDYNKEDDKYTAIIIGIIAIMGFTLFGYMLGVAR